MRVPLQWLADYVDVDLTSEELGHALTMAGLKIEAIDSTGAAWEDVYTGSVETVQPHPASKKPLSVATVDVGDRTITVVTGAPNVRLGDRVPVVLVGGVLPHGPDGKPMRIEARPMAGITSEGMLASARELGISDDHAGILILPPDTPVGVPLRSLMGGDVLDIETSPNRPDTLSIIGIAREVAALTRQQLTLSDLDAIGPNMQWLEEESVSIQVADPELCPRYSALRIDGVSVQPSPLWLADRLQAAGMRPINLLVDITNYVMLEYGQPMHAFDAGRLGDRIVVRRAVADERIVTLDGVERMMSPETLVIADQTRPVAIAGVMGGEDTEIGPETTSIILESATFDAVSVRRTAQSLGLRSEASSRFEKGLPVEQTVMGLRRFLQLLVQITDSQLRVARISDVAVTEPPPRHVTMQLRDLHRLIGVPIPADTAEDALSLLGFGVRRENSALTATVPFWRRSDVELPADLIEEVARVVGYDTLPATLPSHTMAPLPPPATRRLASTVGERLRAAGVSEAVTHGLTSPTFTSRLFGPGYDSGEQEEERWARLIPNAAGVVAKGALTLPVCLANPATRDRQMLRLTLVPGLLDVVARNLKQTDERVAFYEEGRTIFRRPHNQELPYERQTLALALSGRRQPGSWQTPRPEPYTFFDLKGMLAALFDTLHIKTWSTVPAHHPALHPGRSAVIILDGRDVAYCGELHPDVAAAFDILGWPVQVAEVDLDAVFATAGEVEAYRPLPRFPAAYRDIAVTVDREIPAESVLAAVRAAGEDLLESARIFDVYSGETIAVGKTSIAIGLTFRARDATLTQDEVAAVMERIVTSLQRNLGATLRD